MENLVRPVQADLFSATRVTEILAFWVAPGIDPALPSH